MIASRFRRLLPVVVPSLVLALLGSTASATVIRFAADLDGASEFPPNASPGTGHADLEYDPIAHTLLFDVDFADLLGTTTAAHIHATTAVPFGGIAGVAVDSPLLDGFPTGVTAGTYLHTYDLASTASYSSGFLAANGGTAAGAEAGLLSAIEAGRAYFNIHSTVFPGGEIRGFPQRVPDTGSTVVMLALGAVGVVASRRRS